MSRSRTAATARRTVAPHAPRRVSGPIRPGHPRPASALPPRLVAPAPVRPQRTTTGISDRLKAVPDHRWLDALLRSRAWIWMLGIALLGIVFMQVSLLSMNAGIGRAVQASEDLEHANARLSEEVAELSGGERIGALAERMGLIAPVAGDVGYLDVRPGDDAVRAAQNMIAPTATARARMEGAPATSTTTTVAAAPVATATPAPVAVSTPAPVATATPAPVATATPAPVTASAPAPVTTAAPSPTAPAG